ncbi:MAG TPA: hypothetical protein VHM70_04660 [Polyangiaceae bacterium]|jgi:hypothetical protein|nr:hypothetical protein [Polyangiaceae bacterium]
MMSAITSPKGSSKLVWLNEWTLIIEWYGQGNFDSVSEALAEVRATLKTRPLRFLVCDTLNVTDFDSNLRTPADALLKEAKTRGMSELVVVAQIPALRMLAFGLGLVVGTRTRVFVSRSEAENYCNQRTLHGNAPRP